MPSKESWSGRKTNRATVHKSKQEGRQQDLLIAALGMKLGSQKSSVTIWQPLNAEKPVTEGWFRTESVWRTRGAESQLQGMTCQLYSQAANEEANHRACL